MSLRIPEGFLKDSLMGEGVSSTPPPPWPHPRHHQGKLPPSFASLAERKTATDSNRHIQNRDY